MIDRNALLEDLDIEAYTDYLGIEKRRRGSRTFIRCPGHAKRLGKADRNITNAVLTGKGYYCFSCNEYHNAIDMTEEASNCNFKEATQKICIFLGKDYFKKQDKKPVRCPISKEDLKLIGIGIANHKARSYIGYGDESGEKVEYGKYLKYESAYWSIDELYRTDYEGFSYLVGQKALEAYKRIQCLVDLFLPENGISELLGQKIFGKDIPSDFSQGLHNALKDELKRVENIICSLTPQNAA